MRHFGGCGMGNRLKRTDLVGDHVFDFARIHLYLAAAILDRPGRHVYRRENLAFMRVAAQYVILASAPVVPNVELAEGVIRPTQSA